MPKCAPEWPLREDPAHKDYLELALQTLRERHRHESAAAILRAYSRPEEGLKLSTLKLFLRPDHKGPVRGLTRHALIRAGQRAWGRHCPLAQLYDQLAVMLLGPSGRNAIEPFYGRHRWLDRRKGERHEVSNAAAVMGPCAKCGRPLFQIKPRNVVRCGFAFNVSTRLYIFAVERNYMRMAVLRSPDVPGADPLVGILLAEEKDPAAQVVAAKAALVPEASPWYGRGDLQERVSKVLVNEMDLGLPDGTLTGWKSLPPLPE